MGVLKPLAWVANLACAEFWYVYAGVTIVVSASLVVAPLALQFLPSSSLGAAPKLKVDLRSVFPGSTLTATWGGSLVFIRNRTLGEIRALRRAKVCELKDKLARNDNLPRTALALDGNRCVSRRSQNWLVVMAPCTHLGCVPEVKAYGWYCACHGSVYDCAGRVVSGPAPFNLRVPPSALDGCTLVVG